MVGQDFIDGGMPWFHYNLVFSQNNRETITQPPPSLLKLFSSRYTIMPKDIYAYWGLQQLAGPEPAPETKVAKSLFPNGILRIPFIKGIPRIIEMQ